MGPTSQDRRGIAARVGAVRGMGDEDKSREQLVEELARMHRRLASLEGPEGPRERAEEALRKSEERFRLLVEGVKDYAIFMLDPEGRVASWNEGASASRATKRRR